MRSLILLVLAMCILSCTTVNHNKITVEKYHYNYIDSAFYPMIKSFTYEAGSRGFLVDLTNVSMTFGDIRTKQSDKTVGYCVPDPLGGLIIKIHTPTWSKLGPYQQEQLIFHEMAHCLMRRDHCTKTNKLGPISIMYPQVLDEMFYKQNREELVDELFRASPECVGDDGDAHEVNGQVCPQAPNDIKR